MIKCPHCGAELNSWMESTTVVSEFEFDSEGNPVEIGREYVGEVEIFCPKCLRDLGISYSEIEKALGGD